MTRHYPLKTLLAASAISIAVVLSTGAFFSHSNAQETAEQSAVQAAQVTVAQVISERITEWDEFTGRIAAPHTVELRPRVSGYIDFTLFEEGSLVTAGDPLFAIDNRQFKVEVKRLAAELAQATSQRQLALSEYKRAQNLVAQKAISDELLDTRRAAQQQAKAQVEAIQAALELAKLNLSYTHVIAPISGRISNARFTKGNYVSAGQSVLTSIVSTEKAYAYFDADEQTYLKYRELAKKGQRKSSRNTQNPVYMGLANSKDYPYAGVIDFVDNKVNPQTGTIRGRAVFDNSDGLLIPGLFTRIKLLGSASHNGILIDDKAIATDLNNKYVLVLDENNQVQYRAVTLGEKHNGLRIIKQGLDTGEKVVTQGLQRVRPGSPVNPILKPMTDAGTLSHIRAEQGRLDILLDDTQYASSLSTPETEQIRAGG